MMRFGSVPFFSSSNTSIWFLCVPSTPAWHAATPLPGTTTACTPIRNWSSRSTQVADAMTTRPGGSIDGDHRPGGKGRGGQGQEDGQEQQRSTHGTPFHGVCSPLFRGCQTLYTPVSSLILEVAMKMALGLIGVVRGGGCGVGPVGAGRRRPVGADLREGRRADLLFQVRRVPPPDDVRADVAGEVRRGAAVGAVDQAARGGAHHAAVGRRPRARRLQERPAPVGQGDRDHRRLGRCRRAQGQRQGPAGGADVRRGLDHRQARRRVHDDRRLQDSRRPASSSISTCALPTSITEDKWIQAIEIKPQAARARAPRARLHAADRLAAERERRARPGQHRRRHAEQARRGVRAGRRPPADRQLRHRAADALHDQRRGDDRPHAGRHRVREGARRRCSSAAAA